MKIVPYFFLKAMNTELLLRKKLVGIEGIRGCLEKLHIICQKVEGTSVFSKISFLFICSI